MKKAGFLLIILFLIATSGEAQTYKLNQIFLTINSRPIPYDAKIEITKDFLITTAYTVTDLGKDSTVTKESILKSKGGYVKTQVNGGVMNYEFAISSDKKEKKANIYVISQLYVSNAGDRKIMYFKGTLIE